MLGREVPSGQVTGLELALESKDLVYNHGYPPDQSPAELTS